MDLNLLPLEIQEAHAAFPVALAACDELDALNRLKGAYTGREGSHAARLMDLLKTAPKEQKRDLGAVINGLKQAWEEGLKSRQAELEAAASRWRASPRTGMRSCRGPCRPEARCIR